jgi:hypothetical protein
MSATSDRTLRPHGKLNPLSFIILCVRAVFSDKVLHGRWLQAEQLHVYMHMKCNVGDDIKFSSASMMRAMNKALPLTSVLPNKFEIPGGMNVNVFQHSFQIQKRRHFFWVTSTLGEVPPTPCNGNSTSWEHDCVLTRLLSEGRSHHAKILAKSRRFENPCFDVTEKPKNLVTHFPPKFIVALHKMVLITFTNRGLSFVKVMSTIL